MKRRTICWFGILLFSLNAVSNESVEGLWEELGKAKSYQLELPGDWIEMPLIPTNRKPDYYGKDGFNSKDSFDIEIPGFWLELRDLDKSYMELEIVENGTVVRTAKGFYLPLPVPRHLLKIAEDVENHKAAKKANETLKNKSQHFGEVKKDTLRKFTARMSKNKGIFVEYPFGKVGLGPKESLKVNRKGKDLWYVQTKHFLGEKGDIREAEMCPIDLALAIADETILSEHCSFGKDLLKDKSKVVHPSPIHLWFVRPSSLGDVFAGIKNAEFCPMIVENHKESELFQQPTCRSKVRLKNPKYLVERGIAYY